MPRANRVQPDGTFLATEARGTLMGNRGILHDADGRIGPARWRHKAWVCCALSFRGRHRTITAPGRYTELFFLDEAVALAAGHRPCAECRRADHRAWVAAWGVAFGDWPGAAAVSDRMHAARAHPGARRLRHKQGRADDLPDGTFLRQGDETLLLHAGSALAYTREGYGPARPRPGGTVTILTNPVTRAVLASGYRPALHASATP